MFNCPVIAVTDTKISNMQVSILSASDLSTRSEFTMPEGTTFKEEGGASMHPDGTRFAAVSIVICDTSMNYFILLYCTSIVLLGR
jgi:hypothetical protein